MSSRSAVYWLCWSAVTKSLSTAAAVSASVGGLLRVGGDGGDVDGRQLGKRHRGDEVAGGGGVDARLCRPPR